MSVITRDFINKNIEFFDLESEFNYKFNELSEKIDIFKNLFLEHGVDDKKSYSVVIGIMPSLDQTACLFACFELGITVCIIDYYRLDNFTQYQYVDPKTELLLPIDFFIVRTDSDTDKFDYFNSICKKTIVLNKIKKIKKNKNKTIYAKPNSIIMKCTSSGTTGTPKVITHSHQFMYNLALRNSIFFDNHVAINYNLNHGSSFATYFLPALCSKNVDKISNIIDQLFYKEQKNKNFFKKINHIMMTYKDHVEDFIKYFANKETTIYTLTSIPSDFKIYTNLKFKDIISFFGCNETSGPVLINKISNKNFSSSYYYIVDNFYDISIDSGTLNVKMPYYNNLTIDTKDRFINTDSNSIFEFKGRDDLIKINGKEIKNYNFELLKNTNELTESDFIFDVQENLIYLAIWKSYDDVELKIKKINKTLTEFTKNKHCIDKYAILDKHEFMSGIKIDNELIRHYFRKYVKYQKL